MLESLSKSVASQLAKQVFKTKKNSPHIFFGLGLLGVVASTVLACRATLKLEETLDDIKEEADDLQMKQEYDQLNPGKEYSDINFRKERSFLVARSTVKLGKLYGPSVVVGGAAVVCLTGSHVQLTRRNAAVTAAFTAATKAYEDYRERVRDELGNEKEKDLHQGVKEVSVTENGKKKLVKRQDPNERSMYARCFDASSTCWHKNPEDNLVWLKVQNKWANQRLERDGFLFLNDVYEALGFERTGFASLVGWRFNSQQGDGYIDFGLYDERNSDFLNTTEPCCWLDFNVDGVIWDKID